MLSNSKKGHPPKLNHIHQYFKLLASHPESTNRHNHSTHSYTQHPHRAQHMNTSTYITSSSSTTQREHVHTGAGERRVQLSGGVVSLTDTRGEEGSTLRHQQRYHHSRYGDSNVFTDVKTFLSFSLSFFFLNIFFFPFFLSSKQTNKRPPPGVCLSWVRWCRCVRVCGGVMRRRVRCVSTHSARR